MLRLRSRILAHLLHLPSASPVPPLHRLLAAAAAPRISANPSFAVEEYLVSTCGLTRAQAIKASAKLSHLKSPAKPDAVLAFLAGLGFSTADVATLVAKDPRFLCAKVEKSLAPNVDELLGLGLSLSQIVRLIALSGGKFRCRSIVSNLQYYLSLFGSSEKLLLVLSRSSYLLGADIERRVKPNIALLQDCGVGARDIVKLGTLQPGLFITNPERIWPMVLRAEGLGVSPGSPMFKHALLAVAFLSEETIAARVEHLKKAFRWSDAEAGIAVSKAPSVLSRNNQLLQRKSEFLISEAGLEPAYVARWPVMLTLSLEGRLRPRYYVVKFLKENGLLRCDPNYPTLLKLTEEVFVQKYICPHKEAAPHLAQDYADTCRGQVPTRFRFT